MQAAEPLLQTGRQQQYQASPLRYGNGNRRQNVPTGKPTKNTTFKLSMYASTMPGIKLAGTSVYIAVGDCLTMDAGASGAYLTRFLPSSEAKTGSARSE